MFITLVSKARHAVAAWRRFPRSTGSAIIRAAVFLALFHNPVPVFGVIPLGLCSVSLAWEPSISANVVGYNVYCGVASGVYDRKISVAGSTSVTVPGLVPGITYYFAATAVDTLGNESPFSNETSYTPGVPRLRVRAASAGQFVLTVSGMAGQIYEIEASQDLKHWTIIGVVTLGLGGSVDFTDNDASQFPQRFYRTLEIL